MKLYNNKMVESLINKKNKGKKMIFFPLFSVIPLLVILLIFVKLNTKNLYVFFATFLLSIYSFILIYNLIENRIKPNDYIKHIESILKGNRIEFEGVITNISDTITLKRNIHILEIEISNDKSIVKAYFNIDLFKNEFKINDNIKVKLCHNFITEYEV